MSYVKQIENYNVKFKEEINYLNCRIDYLGHLKFVVMPEVSFLQFIQNEMYDKNRCDIESIEMMSGESNSVFNDNYYTIATDFAHGNSFPVYNGDLVTADNIIDGDLIFNSSSNISSNDSNNSVWVNLHDYGWTVSNETKNKLNNKKEEPDDPVESRFDILDIREEDE